MSMLRFTAAFGAAMFLTFSAAAQTGADWPTFGGDHGGGQYTPLDQITPENVNRLEVAWTHHSGDVAWLEVTPIHNNNTLYYCTPRNRLIALDPATGAEKWRADPHSDEGGAGITDAKRVTARCRSAAYWEAATPTPDTPCEKRVFWADLAGNVYAADADTGAFCKDFGAAAGHPGYVSHNDQDLKGEGHGYSTSGPIVVGDLIIAATGSEDMYSDATNGMTHAWDVRTGELKWQFDPIPPEHAHDTGAANVWSTLSADVERKLVFLPTTPASPDFFSGNRDFDVPYATATVALNAETGEPVWHFQAVHRDIYDYDLPGHPLLVTITKDGQQREVAIQQSKMGYVFVFDRATGEPVFPIPEKPVPQSDVPGEITSPTQPMPDLPEPFARQHMTRDDVYGLTPIDRAWCRRKFDSLRYEGMYTPSSINGSLTYPAHNGAGNWGGAAYDPNTNTLVVKSMGIATMSWLVPKPDGGVYDTVDGGDEPGNPMKGTPYRIIAENFMSPLGVPCSPPPWGQLTAIDMDTGKIKWQMPYGQIVRYGITFPKFLGWGSAILGGPIVTRTGLIFMGASMDKKMRALDINTGNELWSADLPYAGMAVPMSYMADGKQYVAIAAGGNRRTFTTEGDAIVAFRLKD